MAGLVQLLAAYPPGIVESILSPISGIPAKHKFLPSLAEIRDLLEARTPSHMPDIANAISQTLALRAPDKPAQERPTLDDLRAKHGPNWGLHPDPGKPRGFVAVDLKTQFGMSDADWNAIPNAETPPRFVKLR